MGQIRVSTKDNEMDKPGLQESAGAEKRPPELSVTYDRREAVRRMAIFGAYTAPALIAVLHSTKAAAASCIDPPVVPPSPNKPCQGASPPSSHAGGRPLKEK